MARFRFDFGWKLVKDWDKYRCPACGAQNAMHVDMSDESNIDFQCAAGCSRYQILIALDADPEGTYYIGLNKEDLSTEQDTAQQLLALFSVQTFPDFVRLCKKAYNGSIPGQHDGINVDDLAALCGYKIAADRRSCYQPPVIATAADLLAKDLKPPTFAVEGLLPAGLCIFSAPSKTGKSWLALDLCSAVATGAPFMGRQTNQGDALYLALEDSEYGLQKRLRKLNCTSTDAFHYAFTIPNVGSGMTDFLSEWCAAVKDPRLIVIDVLQRAKPTGRSNKTAYEQDYDLYAPLNAFALEKGIAILAITHNRKSNGLAGDDYESISGSVGQMGAAQTAWLITGKRGQGEEKTFKATGRDIREVEDIVSFNPDSCRWENKGGKEEAVEQRAQNDYAKSPIRETLIQLLAASPSGSWYGSYEELFNEIANRTGQYPFLTEKELALGIRPLLPLLERNDGICKIADTNKKGGKYHHTFFRKNLLSE